MYGNDALKLNRNFHHCSEILKVALNQAIITTFLKASLRAPLFRSLPHVSTPSDPHYSAFHGEGLQRTYIDAVETLNIETAKHAVARLERGGPFPVVRAASGWTTYATSAAPIDAALWTKEVFRISKLVDHDLTQKLDWALGDGRAVERMPCGEASCCMSFE